MVSGRITNLEEAALRAKVFLTRVIGIFLLQLISAKKRMISGL